MKKFEEQKFNLGILKGISTKNIEEHLKLYAGYVKNTNLILEKISNLSEDLEKNAYLLGEIQRRFGFEYNGMRNHEIYFASLSDNSNNLEKSDKILQQIEQDFESFEKWLEYFKLMATTRGLGWAMLYWDRKDKKLLNAWVDEQHLGQLGDCALILALDMWEHAYVYDYPTSEKKKYIEAFFDNLNWKKIEENFQKTQN